MKVHQHLNLLGMKVEDKVTGAKGVVSCVSFDLYGCIQTIVVPSANDKGEIQEGKWMDISRLKIVGKNPVMSPPDFEQGSVADGLKGPAAKALFSKL